jgi:MraZ protein
MNDRADRGLPMLYGHYPATVDAKGRLKLPTVLRPFLDEAYGPDFFVTSIDSAKSLRLYPLPEWRKFLDKLNEPPSLSRAKVKLIDQTTYWGQVSRIDKQGRILIPARLREPAAMLGEVAVLAQSTFLKVWNHERLREHIESQPLTDDDLNELSGLGI